MAARLPTGAASLNSERRLRGHGWPGPWRAFGRAALRGSRRLAADLRSGRVLLAAELSRPGWLDFGAFRWRDLAAGQAVRAALGVMTPLVVGVAIGRVEYGSFAALGALPAGFVSFRGVSRTRVAAVLFATLGMAVSTFAGATAAREPWLLVPVVFAWAYTAGVLAALGPTVLAVTLQWPVALLVASALPLRPADAALRAGLVLAGGLWQCVLVILSWTLGRGSAERTALSLTYAGLARYASRLAAGTSGPPDASQLPASYVLADPNPLMLTAAREHMLDLADEAVRIRTTLAALSIAGPDGAPSPAVRTVLARADRVLAELAADLGGRSRQRDEHVAAAARELRGIPADTGAAWQWAADALLGQLRSASRILSRLNLAEPVRGEVSPPRPVRQAWRRDVVVTVRASVGTSSEAGRHALRLAVVTAAAEAIVHGAGLSHGYWAVLTIFIVLRPDYSSTLYRGLQRAAGTLVGAGLGLATVQLGRLGLTALLIGVGVSLVAAYAVFTVNYLLYGVFLTDFIVVLLALLGLAAEPTAVARLIGTGIGAGLAITAYLLWPTWEAASAADKFGGLYLSQGRYASALLRAYTRPGEANAARLRQLRMAARRARLNAEASASRLAGEPDHPPITAHAARMLESAGHRIAQACLALGAAVTAHHADGAVAESDVALQGALDRFAGGVDAAVAQIAAVLTADPGERPRLTPGGAGGSNGPRPPADTPPLRDLQQAISPEPDAASKPRQARPSPATGDFYGLSAATDSLVDAINTAAHAVDVSRGGDPGR